MTAESQRRAFRSFAVPLLLGLVCFFVYNANLRQIGAGDTLPARYLPLILWHYGTLDLDAAPQLVAHGHSLTPDRNRPAGAEGKVTYFEPSSYWMVRTRDHQLASLYPVVTPLLVAPLYLPAVLWLDAHGWDQPNVDRVAELMEKISASVLASLASVLLFLLLRREGSAWSLPLALAFAFGTNTWMISSQALWQHGAGELLIVFALLLVVSTASPVRTALLGVVCIFMAANRPPDAFIAAAIVLFIAWSRRRNALWLLAGAALPLAAILYYNLGFIGHYAGAYALAKAPHKPFFQLNWSGVPGLLVSPTRGLLVFTPFLIFVPIGLIQRLRTPASKGLAIALGFAVAAQVILYGLADWRAGVSWGPRWLTNLLPILVWLLAPAPLILRRSARTLLVLAIVFSVGVQTAGAFWYTHVSDARIFEGDPTSMQAAWNPRNLPYFVELRHPRARGTLQCNAAGSIDRIGPTSITATSGIPLLEQGAVIDGWTSACGRPPVQLLLLIDGIVIGTTANFQQREGDASGWRITANTAGVPTGERILQLAVLIESGSDIRIVREQRVLVNPKVPYTETAADKTISTSELDTSATRAAALLRERQSPEGYWLTTHTKRLRYENPKPEMNTFMTSMLVDLLGPIAQKQNLSDIVERAKNHLVAQIEPDGLVRYHGLPSGPLIGKLGCAITPDPDDTALVWKIRGQSPTDPRQPGMLAELARYRDRRGLYRSWLAPQNKYQCLDPGLDPNPTDLTIQLHVYLMLREFDPPAAQNLCKGLQRSFWDGDIWVYYSKAPLVPYFRIAELDQYGCSLPSPTERLTLPAAGQEIWSESMYWLVHTMKVPPVEVEQEKIREVLARLAGNDFALLRSSPPMLYHNDLSASVKRFYWSEDVGYAMWLRLYEVSHKATP